MSNLNNNYILALDQGTTSCRTLIFDVKSDGKVGLKGSNKQEFTQHFPVSDMVEHDATEILNTQLTTVRLALQQAQLQPTDIACIGITNQRESVMLWDKNSGKPLHRVLVWQDKRTTDFMNSLKEAGVDKMLRAKTGLLSDPYFSASKIKWLLDNVAGARDKAQEGSLAAGTMDAWLVYCLTAGKRFITDVTNASRTLLFNIHSVQWDDELLEIFDIPKQILPQVVTSTIPLEEAPRSSKDVIGAEIPITGIAGDQHAALLGQGCVKSGMIKNTYGTGCFMLMNTGDKLVESSNGLLTTIAWQLPNAKPIYALEGSIFAAGSVIQWLRDGLGLIKNAVDINEVAAKDNGGVYFVPAFAGLGSPHWDPRARGTIIGITRGTEAGHLARAALESIAFQSVELAELMKLDAVAFFDDGGNINHELRADGGVSASSLFMQIQADLLGQMVKLAQIEEATALGAAYFAGLALGFWNDTDEIYEQWSEGATYKPAIDKKHREVMMTNWNRAVERSKGWA